MAMPRTKNFFSNWPLLAIFFTVLVFFFPVWLRGLLPLPLDALVGAHVPWTELRWKDYPTGIPIKNLEITDSTSQFYPWRSLVGEFWKAGKVPLWNSYMFSGTPFLATLHSAALYPLNVFYIFLPNHLAWTALIVSQILLAAIFMYLFLTNLGLKKEASFLGAIAFSFSGYMIAWLEFATGGQAGLWLPLLLMLEYNLVKSGRFFWVLLISFIFFFIFTAGDFQVPLYISLTYILFGVFLIIQRGILRSLSLKRTFFVLVGVGLGILLSLPQLLPTVELFKQSIRADDSYIREYFFGLMDWVKAVNFIWPDFFGNVTTGNYWGRFGFHEYISFTGIVTVVFAVYSLISKKTATEKFFLFLLITSLLFLFPTPFGFLPYKLHLPALGTSSASRIIFLVDFCLAILGAYGFSKWQGERKSAILRILLFFLIITIGMGMSLMRLVNLTGDSSRFGVTPAMIINFKVSLRNMIPTTLVLFFLGALFFTEHKVIPKLRMKLLSRYFLVMVPFVVLVVTTAELLRFAWKNTSFSPAEFLYPQTKTLDFLERQPRPFRIAGGIPTNLFMPFGIESAEGYDPIYPLRYGQWISAVESGKLGSSTRRYGLIHNFSSPLINYANVEYIVDYKKGPMGDVNNDGAFYSSLEPLRYQPVFSEGRVSVFKNTQSFPRVWLSGDYKLASEPAKIIEDLSNPMFARQRLIILESEPEISIEKTNLTHEVKHFKETYNKVEIGVSASDNALLFLSQTFFPGWKAFVDGQEVKVLRANYTFQAIAFPKGEHKIEFIYNPLSFKVGLYLSLGTLIFLLGRGVIVYKTRKE